MAGLAEAVQAVAGQPASVRVGVVSSTSPVEISAQGVPFDDIGILNGYIPRTGDSVVMLGQSSAAGTDPASWLALGPASSSGTIQVPTVSMMRSAVLSIPSALGATTFVPWDGELFDNYGMGTVGSTDLVAVVGGIYHVTMRVRFTSNATGIRIASLYINGVATNQESALPAITGVQTSVEISADLLLNAGDAVAVVAKQNSGVALDLTFAWGSMFLVTTA